MVKPVWNNAHRVNHQNFAKKTHPCAKKNMVPRAVLIKSGLVSINTAREVNAAHLKTTVNVARSMTCLSKTAYSTVNRPIHKNTSFKNSNVNQTVNIVRGNTARPKAVVNAVKGNNLNAIHKWIYRIKELDGGYVAFGGNPKGGKITGKGSGPDWLFDIDALTRIMNYALIVEGTQSNGFTGTKASDNVGQARKETEPVKDYVLLPLWTADPLFSKNRKNSNDDGSKPSSNDGKKVDEDLRNENECNDQEKKDNVNNTNNVNTVSSTVNVAGTNEDNELPFDLNMHALEDVNIFNFSSDDEDNGAVADMNNLDTTIQVSSIPTTRIHNDHPLDQVIEDLQSATQTRRMSKNLEKHRFCGVSNGCKKCFLYGKIEEEVYVCQPPGFEDPDFLDRVYKVEKALYGLHQAPRAWYKTLSTYLLDNGFQKGKIDKTLFIKRHKVCACARYQVNIKVSHLYNVKRTFRKPKRKDTQVSQPSDPTESIIDEAIHKELGDSLVRAATTASSLAAEYESGNILRSDEDSMKLNELMELCTNLQNRVLNLEKTKTTQKNEIDSLKRRVKKLEKRNRSRTHKLKRLYKVGLSARVESSRDEESLGEDASKQGKIDDIDADEDITLVNDVDNEMFDIDDLGGEEVFVAGQNEYVVKKVVNVAQVSTATITTKEITLAQALEAVKTSKPKVKGIVFQEPCKSTTTTTIVSSQQSHNKGKGIMIGEPVKPKKKDQIRLDEEAVLKLQAEAFKWVNTFEDIRTKLVKRKKRAEEELIQESTKKQKEDLEDLYKLVKARYGSTRPVESMDYLLWSDMKTMFEPHVEDEGRIVGIKSFLDAVEITAAHVCVNTAQLKLVLLVNFNEKYTKIAKNSERLLLLHHRFILEPFNHLLDLEHHRYYENDAVDVIGSVVGIGDIVPVMSAAGKKLRRTIILEDADVQECDGYEANQVKIELFTPEVKVVSIAEFFHGVINRMVGGIRDSEIHRIHKEHGWVYIVCKNCNKKVDILPKQNRPPVYVCEEYGTVQPASRFKVVVRVIDKSDEYCPEELDNIVGKKCLFKLLYSEYNVEKNNHTYRCDSFFEDVELTNYFKNNFRDIETDDEELSDDFAQSTTKENNAMIEDSIDKHASDIHTASKTRDSTTSVEGSSSKKSKLIIDLDEVKSEPEDNISKTHELVAVKIEPED
uniref:Replication protein A 70 kDa DNA-binding subunit B n=1 Tax=Tanacetum cinerariifolium TaxID=118510 RepID=A0A6L2M9M7_TANCI|nr:replication protein A 70 kDa DNA-binding subunit B [Tanacetum cinerariifolium]